MRLIAIPLFSSILTVSTFASAQVADPVVAEALFRDGKALHDAGRIAEACKKFAESQRIDPKLGTLLNLANCHKDEAKFATAWEEYSEAVRVAKRTSQKDREQLAQGELEALETVLTRVVINMPSPVQGQEITLDGLAVRAETLGTPLPINPGDHKVEVKAPGYEPLTLPLKAEKVRANLTLEIPPLKPAPTGQQPAGPGIETPPPPPPASTSPLTMRTGSYVALGVGVVGIGVGTIFGLRSLSKRDEAAPNCPGNVCNKAGKDLGDEAHSAATLSTVGMIVGVAGVASGVTLFVLSRPSGSSVSFAPVVTPRTAAFTTQVTF